VSESTAAINAGCALVAAGDAKGALARFQESLTLPGSGIKKDRAKPAELSTGEKQAAYFNWCAAASAWVVASCVPRRCEQHRLLRSARRRADASASHRR
jgi:hypothetical protein